MRFQRLLLLLAGGLILFSMWPELLRAQERTIEVPAAAMQVERIEPADTLIAPRSITIERGRFDPDVSVVRARYRIDPNEVTGGEPEAAARRYLTLRREEFGLGDDTSDLTRIRLTETSHSRHLTFQQTRDGIPVLGGNVKVNLDADGRPTMVISNYRPHVADAALPQQRLSSEAAVEAAATRAGGRITLVGEPELVIYPSDAPRIAWHIIARPPDDSAEWSILIDAATGETIRWMDQSTHARPAKSIFNETHPSNGKRSTEANVESAATVTGRGLVFDPDPLTTAGVDYGPPYIDANDADVPELNAQRQEVALREITRGVDGLYRLEGPYVRIVSGNEIGASYTLPLVSVADGFRFGRGNDFFEAVNSYYHIHESQLYIQEQLDPNLDIHRFPIRVNPHGMGNQDNSRYLPASNALQFGTGGIDDAEDAHVILHEYAHALLQASAPGLLGTIEGQALHEGWADYWAVSYTRELIESGQVPFRDWRKVFTWDGNESWNGRWLDHTGRYPNDTPCAREGGGGGGCVIHEDGRLWATTLMEIYTLLGRRTTDHLNLLSHAYLAAPATMRDAAEAILQADQDYYDGDHLSTLLEVFRRRGFVDTGAFAPHITHAPPPSTETQSTIRIEAEVTSEATTVTEVRVVVLPEDGEPITHQLLHEHDAIYAADIPLDGIEGELRYYIEAVDDAGQVVRYPGTAPQEVLALLVGPDDTPPVIVHDPPGRVNIADFPATITANVTDRMGVERVWVEFQLTNELGIESGEFELAPRNGLFEGTFPPLDVEPGSSITYHIFARDASDAGNEAVAPAEGAYSIEITSGPLVRYYSFDGDTDEGVTANGIWERGAPSFGTTMAWSGDSVWGTVIDGSYPEQQSLSSLMLPRLTVRGASEAYLVFWHWFDTEHDGRAYPEEHGSATPFDGGNVKFSTDDGATWEVLQPEGGYSGRISAGYENPLSGELGFGGFSRGWRREIMPLPTDEPMLIRFDFGTDAANSGMSQQFAGWYIDDVEIRTVIPVDESEPAFVELPEAFISSGAAHPPVRLSARVQDDTGVESVMLYSQLLDASGSLVRRDTLAFDMSSGDRMRFDLDFQPDTTIRPGYTAEYQLRARDFDGNEVWATSGGEGFRIVYLHYEATSVLDELKHTGLWTWSENRWITAWRRDVIERSSMLIGPLDLPVGASELELHLDHQYLLGQGVGGNVKISSDDGRTWSVLPPVNGYDAVFAPGTSHDMSDEDVFEGSASDVQRSVFDLSAWEGKQVRIRLDYGATRAATQNDWWAVHDASLNIVASDDDLPIPRELRLHSNYPDPFSSTTTIGYTLPEDSIILLEVYDALGRRIDVIRYALQLAGTYTFTYDGSRLSAGMYFLSLTIDGRRHVERMVVAR